MTLSLHPIETSPSLQNSFLILSNNTYHDILREYEVVARVWQRQLPESHQGASPSLPQQQQQQSASSSSDASLCQIIQVSHPLGSNSPTTETSQSLYLMTFPHLRTMKKRQNLLSDRVLGKFATGVSGATSTNMYPMNMIYNGPMEALDSKSQNRVQKLPFLCHTRIGAPASSASSSLSPSPSPSPSPTIQQPIHLIWNIASINIKPLSKDDYEILELNQESVAEQMLNQHRVFSRGQVFPFWVPGSKSGASSPNMVIYLQVEGTSENEQWNRDNFVYIIGRNTEFLIDRLEDKKCGGKKIEKSRLFFEKWVVGLEHVVGSEGEGNVEEDVVGCEKQSHQKQIPRPHPRPHHTTHQTPPKLPPPTTRSIAVDKKWAQGMGFENGDVVELFYTLRFVPQASTTPGMQAPPKMRKTRKTTFALMYLVDHPRISKDFIGVSSDMIAEMSCQSHSRIGFRYSDLSTRQNILSLYLYPIVENHTREGHADKSTHGSPNDHHQASSPDARTLLKNYIATHKTLTTAPHIPCCARSILQLTSTTRYLISFNRPIRTLPSDSSRIEYTEFSNPANSILSNLFLLTESHIETLNQLTIVTSGPKFSLPGEDEHLPRFANTYERNMPTFQALKQTLQKQLHEPTHYSSKISYTLITGDPGCGKTVAAQALLHKLEAHVVSVSCSHLVGERTDYILSVLKAKLSEALFHSPSVLLLDDLDSICPLEQEDGPPDMNIRLISSAMIDLMTQICTRRHNTDRLYNLAFVCTSVSAENLNGMIQDAELFEQQLYLSSPDENLRRQMLRDIWQTAHPLWSVSEGVLGYMCMKTEGYSVEDLENICEASVRSCLVKGSLSESPKFEDSHVRTVTEQDFDEAAENYTRQAEEGIKLVKSKSTWKDVGGLSDVVKAIQETFEYPSQYPEFFKKTPLKLRSGLLLYGPTGCGKTHIAHCAAGACGMNFISVKGPELLNKYIGQSEENVRKLFRQAEAAKPCIIFFDEFDSIAASRGKDTTGVTDRVVNQFLCQMDGVESRDGVYVLAATSRPDLVDAALLRPGRLDKALYCGFPSLQERQDILSVIARGGFKLHEDVKLDEIARVTEHFTGADLQGLLTNASILAANEIGEGEASMENGGEADHGVDWMKGGRVHVDVGTDSTTSAGVEKVNESPGRTKLSQDSQHVFEALSAVHLDASEGNGSGMGMEKDSPTENMESQLWIHQRHLMEALEESQPSVGKKERARLEYIYSQFREGKKGGNEGNNFPRDEMQHVTLA